ncbi:PAS domain S-box protein [Spirosoma linguale]|uniref:histidine kinase n=1 Tax=Spirosoma linguale (strain ATCC 33905 / DSM 74 / LMG 10896 / Claus 1) TaxID=504472 RepID=D2QPX3_SPILD|nr:PAS/PAC sensor signal transduction histidine kinase [Spirosoma linguale DSM 74]
MKKLVQLWFEGSRYGVAFLRPVRQQKSTVFRCERVNYRFTQLLEQTSEELTRTGNALVLPFDKADDLSGQLEAVLKDGDPRQGNYYLHKANRWVSLTILRMGRQLVLQVSESDKVSIADHYHGIGGPVNADQPNDLIELNQLLQAVVDSSPAGLSLLRPIYEDGQITDFRYLITNPQNSLITGCSQQTMLEKSLLTLFPHLLTNGIFAKLVDVVCTNVTLHFEMLDDIRNSQRWGSFTLLRVGGDVLFTIQDITRLKRTEADLRQANLNLEQRIAERTADLRQLSAFQQAILTYAGLGISATDSQGVIQLVNPALETLTGYQADELVGKRTPGFLREPSVHHRQVDQLRPLLDDQSLTDENTVMAYAKQYGFIRRENLIQTKSGQIIPVLSTVSGLYDDQNTLLGFVDIVTDISSLKSIEEALTKTQHRTDLAIKAGKLGIWEWNLLTDELILDEHFYAYFSFFEKGCLKHINDFLSLIHKADLALVNQTIESVRQGKSIADLSFRVYKPDTQTTYYLKVDGIRFEGEYDSVRRMIGVVIDQTSQRQAEHSLQESELRYRSLVDNLKEAVFQTDTFGMWTYLNPAWEEITGFSIAESLGTSFLEYVFPEDQKRNLELFEPLMARQKSYCRHEIRYVSKAGGYRWIEVFARVTVNEDNELTGTTGTLTDITERKLAEEALRESEQRFRAIAENLDELFWIRDSENLDVLYMNSAFERLSGISMAELYQNPRALLSIVPEEDQPLLIQAFRQPEPGTDFQFRARHQDGSLRYFHVRLFTMERGYGKQSGRIGVGTDITNVVENKRLLSESLEKERSLNTLKSQFISIASHQFRTPLTSIQSSIDLIQYYISKNNEFPFNNIIQKYTGQISQQITFLEELIMDTLTLSKLEEGKVQVNLQKTDLKTFIQDVIVSTFSNQADGRSVQQAMIGEPMAVWVDTKLMSHVLINLLANAFKFSSADPLLTVRYTPGSVFISVSDKGIGVPAHELPNLFSKFFRASNARQINGTGLGLAICREYMHLQQGHIEVNSEVGVGTTFTITIPIQN